MARGNVRKGKKAAGCTPAAFLFNAVFGQPAMPLRKVPRSARLQRESFSFHFVLQRDNLPFHLPPSLLAQKRHRLSLTDPLLSVPALPMEQPISVVLLLERRACVADVLIPFTGNGYRPELTTVIKHVVAAFNARHIER